jgi:NitT/TauT family transport system substrate-binding protein
VLALKQLGLTPSDVEITALGSVPNVDSALLSGSIAAAASHPPATYKYQQQGYVKLADLAAKKVANANTGFAVTTDYLGAHADIVQKAVDATVKGVQREKKDKAFAEQVMKKYMGITDQAVLDFTYDFYANEVAANIPMPETDQFTASQQALGAKNDKIKAVDLSSFIDQSYVKKAAADLGLS